MHALFWNDPGTTIQPPGHWLQIANAAMLSQGSNLLQSAQLTALMGEAMNDAGILAWDEKYTNNLWRPVTAIRDCSDWSAGNFTTCDATWSSLIATPPHPDYIAGHPAFSGAAATVLERFFGTDNITFTSTSNYYCNGATSQFDAATNLLVSCTVGSGPSAIVYAVSNPSDCAVILDGINSNGSPLICPISETFSSFSEASREQTDRNSAALSVAFTRLSQWRMLWPLGILSARPSRRTRDCRNSCQSRPALASAASGCCRSPACVAGGI